MSRSTVGGVNIELAAIIVDDYDEAIAFYTEALGFELIDDSPATTNDGRPKRWVVVRPPDAETGILLARADGDVQREAVGEQFAGRVGMFLRVDDFEAAYDRLRQHGVEIVSEPRDEPYGRFAVFVDVCGNRWDLLGPPLPSSEWDEFAAGWNDDPAAVSYSRAAHGSLIDILDQRGRSVAGTVLDFGCGTGLLTEQIVDRCDRIGVGPRGHLDRIAGGGHVRPDRRIVGVLVPGRLPRHTAHVGVIAASGRRVRAVGLGTRRSRR